jgi:hypothetical protein
MQLQHLKPVERLDLEVRDLSHGAASEHPFASQIPLQLIGPNAGEPHGFACGNQRIAKP